MTGELFKEFRVTTKGGIVDKYYLGPSILWLPFFGLGYVAAWLTGFPIDGYSPPFQWAIELAALFYFWLSLHVLRKLLNRMQIPGQMAAMLLVATALGTNLIYYTVNVPSQIHVFDFLLISSFAYTIFLFFDLGQAKAFYLSTFIFGLILISRPQNGIVLLSLPFLAGNGTALRIGMGRIFSNWKLPTFAFCLFLIPLGLLFSYWYARTGMLWPNPYGQETFQMLHPQWYKFLWSFQKGWMVYTPISWLAVAGILYLWKNNRWQFFWLSIFLFATVSLLSSWWLWHYTSFVGQRVMINFYVFLTIGLAYTGLMFWKAGKGKAFVILTSAFCTLNLFQYFQHLIGVYPVGGVDARAYFQNFLRISHNNTYFFPTKENNVVKEYWANQDEVSNRFRLSHLQKLNPDTWLLKPNGDNILLFADQMVESQPNNCCLARLRAVYKAQPEVKGEMLIRMAAGDGVINYGSSYSNVGGLLMPNRNKMIESLVYIPTKRKETDSLYIYLTNTTGADIEIKKLEFEWAETKTPEKYDWILAMDDDVARLDVFSQDVGRNILSPWENGESSNANSEGSKRVSLNGNRSGGLIFDYKLYDFFRGNDGEIAYSAHVIKPGNA